MKYLIVYALLLSSTIAARPHPSDEELIDCVLQKYAAPVGSRRLNYAQVQNVYASLTARKLWKHELKKNGYDSSQKVWHEFEKNGGMGRPEITHMMRALESRVGSGAKHNLRRRDHRRDLEKLWCH